MNETQILTIALSTLPTMITVLIGILINNSRLGDMSQRLNDMNHRLNDMNHRLNDMNARLNELRADVSIRFEHVNRRLDDLRDMWRAELLRVEDILDARLKHLEGR